MEAEPAPTVSLVVTCFNHEDYVEQALESVSRQTYSNFEVVVVDDCSTDGSVEKIRAWLRRTTVPASLIANERNLGVSAARNRAIRRSRGKYVASLSADDWYEPQKLEVQVRHFETLDDDVAAIFGNMTFVDPRGEALGSVYEDSKRPSDGAIFDRLLVANIVPAPTVMVRRAALDAVGLYDESSYIDDYDMWLRLADRFRFSYLPLPLVNYRLLNTSMTRDPARTVDVHEAKARILLKWFGRDPASDDLIARRVFAHGLAVFVVDRNRGLRLIADPAVTHGSATRRLASQLARFPGSQHGARLALRNRNLLRRAIPSRKLGRASQPR